MRHLQKNFLLFLSNKFNLNTFTKMLKVIYIYNVIHGKNPIVNYYFFFFWETWHLPWIVLSVNICAVCLIRSICCVAYSLHSYRSGEFYLANELGITHRDAHSLLISNNQPTTLRFSVKGWHRISLSRHVKTWTRRMEQKHCVMIK